MFGQKGRDLDVTVLSTVMQFVMCGLSSCPLTMLMPESYIIDQDSLLSDDA